MQSVARTTSKQLQKQTLRPLSTFSELQTPAPSRKAELILEDGTTLPCRNFGAPKNVSGEMVFTTGMVGYTEALTDPSFRGQLLCTTFPMQGNYGVPDPNKCDEYGLPKGFESDQIHAAALLCQDYSHHYANWHAHQSLHSWLQEEGVPGLCDLDTRMLTKKIRSKGAMLARIEVDDAVNASDASARKFSDPNLRNLVADVSTKKVKIFGQGNATRVLAVDCGIKFSIVRQLVSRGCEVTLVPWDFDIAGVDPREYDGLFLSNGPGNPAMCAPTIENLRKIVAREPLQSDEPLKPLFGICLGNQLTALAAGATTSKLPFGNRGQNQPVQNTRTGAVFITPQNHGFAVDSESLPAEWDTLFVNANDGSNEGIVHERKPIFTAQFHPEASGGPTDTEHLFDVFVDNVRRHKELAASALSSEELSRESPIQFAQGKAAPPRVDVKKVLILGSGGLSIGQAGEFDYSGSQAIKALKEEGVQVVLMNPNIASVQTNVDDKSPAKADQVFFLPILPEYVEQVIKREKPDGILVSMGGQTALNCAVELHKSGVLQREGVQVLGTPIDVVIDTEDRDIFARKLREINEKLAVSEAVDTVEDALVAAEKIGYPVMLRSAFALGGLGSGICADAVELRELASKALAVAPQVLVERSLKGWKEVEYEVVRDAADNCVTVCNMENFDPLGVHTGDSVVVAPSQTLSNEEYHMLRETAIKVVRHLGIVGECNIQYALDPHSLEYCIIEVNARLSRSSALASKATGYPLAFVAAKLGLGMTLPDIKNAITQKTQACFEPSLDYCVVKVPRWDLAKFAGKRVDSSIGSAMKSVGEVMAVGRTFEESMQKALRMVDPDVAGFEPRQGQQWAMYQGEREAVLRELHKPSDRRVFAIAQALYDGTMNSDELHEETAIDRWFLRRLEGIAGFRKQCLENVTLEELAEDRARLLQAKKFGFSDAQIAAALAGEVTEQEVRAARLSQQPPVRPVMKQIDTLAAEYPAHTNYLYATYHGDEDDVSAQQGGVAVLGCGAYRIGSSVEFDWCGVSAMRALRQQGRRGIMVNSNPETVSSDFDECDQLYFDELSHERVLDVLQHEGSDGVLLSVGGQTPNNLALPLSHSGVRILGTSAERVDAAEDRDRFSSLVDELGLQQPAWQALRSRQEALDFAADIGYPVMVRPSYVLSGAAMNVANTEEQLSEFLDMAGDVSGDHPVVVSKFIEGAKEIEMDAVARKGEVIAAAVHEHVEQAGVHSGDATLVLPPHTLSDYQKFRVRHATQLIAEALEITGPFNVQFLAKGADVMVIECNLRASRSFPFVSKTMGVDFIEAATRAVLAEQDGDAEAEKALSQMDLPPLFDENGQEPPRRPRNFVGVKSPMFSFSRLRGADPVLGVEMSSTGEVACFGDSREEAFLKAMVSTGFKVPSKGVLLSCDAAHADAEALVHCAWQLHAQGFRVVATADTAELLAKSKVPVRQVTAAQSVDVIRDQEIDLVFNLPSQDDQEEAYVLRRAAVDFGVPLLTNLSLLDLFAHAVAKHKSGDVLAMQPKSLFDYYKAEEVDEAWTSSNEFH